MNRQINPDQCYETDDGVMYMLEPVYGTPEWHVLKDGRHHQRFTSLMAAKGWLEHVLEHGEQVNFKAKLAAALNGGRK